MALLLPRLSAHVKEWLNGRLGGLLMRPPFSNFAINLGDRFDDLARLGEQTNGDGASCVGVEDADNLFEAPKQVENCLRQAMQTAQQGESIETQTITEDTDQQTADTAIDIDATDDDVTYTLFYAQAAEAEGRRVRVAWRTGENAAAVTIEGDPLHTFATIEDAIIVRASGGTWVIEAAYLQGDEAIETRTITEDENQIPTDTAIDIDSTSDETVYVLDEDQAEEEGRLVRIAWRTGSSPARVEIGEAILHTFATLGDAIVVRASGGTWVIEAAYLQANDPSQYLPPNVSAPPSSGWSNRCTAGTTGTEGGFLTLVPVTNARHSARVRALSGVNWSFTLYFLHACPGYSLASGVASAGILLDAPGSVGPLAWVAGVSTTGIETAIQQLLSTGAITGVSYLGSGPRDVRALRVTRRNSDNTIGYFLSPDGTHFVEVVRLSSTAHLGLEPTLVGYTVYQETITAGQILVTQGIMQS